MLGWLKRLFSRPRLERELDRELAFHLDEEVSRLIAEGVAPREARRRARIALGGVEQVKEDARDARGTRWVEEWLADSRYALRGLRRSPGFATAAILTLAVGIGANTAVFSVVDLLLLRSAPVERPEELYLLRRAGLEEGSRNLRFSVALFDAFAESQPADQPVTAFTPRFRAYLTLSDLPEMVDGQLVAGNWFGMLGVRPALGRLIGPDDARTEAPAPVAVISHGYWTRRLGRDAGVIGSSIRVNGAQVTIIGVTEPGFTGIAAGEPADLWLPYGLQPTIRYLSNGSANDADFSLPWTTQRGLHWLWLLVRVPAKPAVAAAEARLASRFRADLEETIAGQDSASQAFSRREHLVLQPAEQGVSGVRQSLNDPLLALMASVGLVLLIACANLASLLMARSASRGQEVAVRVALGARTGRLMRQVLTEAMVLSLAGCAAALLVAWIGSSELLAAAAGETGAAPAATVFNGRVLAFALVTSVGTGLLFGIAPAVRLARTPPFGQFRSAGRATGAGRVRRDRLPMGRLLVGGQVALSMVLVVLAALFAKTLENLVAIDPGYARDQIAIARFDSRAAGYDADSRAALEQRLLEAVRALPGVRSASLSAYAIGSGSAMTSSLSIPGVELGPERDPDAQVNAVSDGYFETVGLPVIAGRPIGQADRAGAPPVAVVSESMARYFFGTDQALGRQLNLGGDGVIEVVGIVPDARINSLAKAPPKMVFVAAAQRDIAMASIEARVDGRVEALLPAIRGAIGGVDRNLPVRDVTIVGDLLERQLGDRKLASETARLFGALALLLAAIGLYGVMAYSVARRTNELGIRLALGASRAGVRLLVLRDTAGIVLAGVGVGLLLAWPATGLVRRMTYGVSPRDPVTLALAAFVLVAVGLAAGALPAWRASRVVPVDALKQD